MIRRSLLLASVVLADVAHAAAAPKPFPQVQAQLKAQAEAWDQAIIRRDRAAIEANMADDFRQIDAQGKVENKAGFVESLVSPHLVLDPYTIEDFDVRLYGDTALLSGRTRITGRYQGQPFNTHYRFIDIYVKRGGAWKIVSVQVSPIAG